MGACLACWGVWRTGVACCLPVAPDVLRTDFVFSLRDDAGVVGWTTLGLELDFGVADLRGWVDRWAERLLPTC